MLWSVLLFALYILILYLLQEVNKKDLEYLATFTRKRKGDEMEQELSGNEPSA